MSPVSRGRKKKRSSSRPAGSGRSGRAKREPTLEDLYAELLRAARPLPRTDDPLDVEVLVSGLVGSWWTTTLPGDDPEADHTAGLIAYAERKGGPAALALLRGLAVLGVRAVDRDAAGTAAARLAAAGVAEPAWVATIGKPRLGDCWRLADVYGDQADLLLEFSHAERRHALVALVDFNEADGWVKDVALTVEPDSALREMRKEAMSEPLMVLDQIDGATARRLLEDGLAATDMFWDAEVSEEFRDFRALALARCRIMPEPEGPAALPEVSEDEREATVTEFLASPHARDLPDADSASFCARLLVNYGADYDGGRALRVSPAKIGRFLHDWVPGNVILDEVDRDAMPAVVTAWARWAGERSGLPPAALAEVVEAATDCGAHFGDVYDQGGDAPPIEQYLEGLDPDGGPDELRRAINRRMFAMPFIGTSIGDEDYAWLDPGDEDERRLLIEGEHPEYHDALHDPASSGEIDGVSLRVHVALHEIVANQLWDDDPPEAWRAARRLTDAGMERHDVLHALASVVASHVHELLANKSRFDREAYGRDLDALRPPADPEG